MIENNKKRIKINEKKLLNKNKSESVSSISSLSSSLLKINIWKKANKSIKHQLILSSENNSNQKKIILNHILTIIKI